MLLFPCTPQSLDSSFNLYLMASPACGSQITQTMEHVGVWSVAILCLTIQSLYKLTKTQIHLFTSIIK